MHFLNPIWLWGLTGLAIPIAIHLLSRKEGPLIYIGSVRHLQESNTSQFRAIKLNEVVLLIIRCLLIVLITLFLAGLQFNTFTQNEQWVLLEKEIENQPEVRSLLDSLEEQHFDKRYLAAGFPTEQDSLASNSKANYWNLIQELSKKDLSNVVVISRSHLANFQGERSFLPANLRWITIDTQAGEYVQAAYKTDGDSLLLRVSQTNSQEIKMEYKKVAASGRYNSVSKDTITVVISYSEEYLGEKNILEAALKSIQTIPMMIMEASVQSDQVAIAKNADWLIWLSEKNPPTTASNVIKATERNSPSLLSRLSSSSPQQEWSLATPLTVEQALESNLVVKLASLLLENNIYLTNDQRVLPEAYLLGQQDENPGPHHSTFVKADHWILILFLSLLFIERLLAYKRNQ